MAMTKRFHIARPAELPAVECPCGEARRALVEESDGVVSLHVVGISADARANRN